MATILKIYKEKDEILRSICRDVKKIEEWVLELADSMWITMEISSGIGIAANQVGGNHRIIAINSPNLSGIMINPIITERSKEMFHFEEGCLSFPGYFIDTGKRNKKITVIYMNLAGETRQVIASDLTSVIIQHEIDHLDGVLFIDHLDVEINKGNYDPNKVN